MKMGCELVFQYDNEPQNYCQDNKTVAQKKPIKVMVSNQI